MACALLLASCMSQERAWWLAETESNYDGMLLPASAVCYSGGEVVLALPRVTGVEWLNGRFFFGQEDGITIQVSADCVIVHGGKQWTDHTKSR